MATDNTPRTYNDAMLDELSREVFYKALQAGQMIIEGDTPFNSERLHAVAALADAAAGGFAQSGEEDPYAE